MSVACCWNSGCAASERSPKPPSPYMYKGRCVGEYFADILVEHSVVIELKCVEEAYRLFTLVCYRVLGFGRRTPALQWRFVHEAANPRCAPSIFWFPADGAAGR